MAANPALVHAATNELIPAPFPYEFILLSRPGMSLELEGVHTASGKWKAAGTFFLTSMRVVFVAKKADPSGLAAFDFPLVYIYEDKLNQPIFGCTNISGQTWPVDQEGRGGPNGSLPPMKFKWYFKEGGFGTFYPLFFATKQRALGDLARAQQYQQGVQQASQFQQMAQPPASQFQQMVHTAFVDPSDPTTLYLSQPVDESQRLQYQPRYAANYGREERYEDMGLRP